MVEYARGHARSIGGRRVLGRRWFTGLMDTSGRFPGAPGCSPLTAGAGNSLGLRRDGTVLATGADDEGQCQVTAWGGVAGEGER